MSSLKELFCLSLLSHAISAIVVSFVGFSFPLSLFLGTRAGWPPAAWRAGDQSVTESARRSCHSPQIHGRFHGTPRQRFRLKRVLRASCVRLYAIVHKKHALRHDAWQRLRGGTRRERSKWPGVKPKKKTFKTLSGFIFGQQALSAKCHCSSFGFPREFVEALKRYERPSRRVETTGG